MPGFLDPLWFVSLAVIPLIRWLHRWQAPMFSWAVSAIFLWDDASQDDAPGPTKKDPDHAWRRRALVAALLITALANPTWRSEVRPLTVWVDDSLSMFAVENGETRLATVMESLVLELDESGSAWADIDLRSLSNPGKGQPYSSGGTIDLDDWQTGRTSEPAGPPVSAMSNTSDHWLLTDGASEGVRTWSRRVAVDRLIQAGVNTENSAVTRLAARRSVDQDDGLDILVSISNTGLNADARQLELVGGRQVLQTTDLVLAPGQTIHWQTQVSAIDQSLTASLTPADSLARDDGLTISLEKFQPLATLVDARCGTAFRLALATHPSLRISDAGSDPDLRVSCPRDRFPDDSGSGAQIRALVSFPQAIGSTPSWLPYAGNRQNILLAAEWISAATWPRRMSDNGHKVLHGSGDTPLVVMHDRNVGSSADRGLPAIVDTVIDMSHPQFIRQPEYAAFVAALTDLATGRQLLNETISASRDVQASIVIPAKIATVSNRSAAARRAAATPLSYYFVLAALILFALDTVLFMRARRGARHA